MVLSVIPGPAQICQGRVGLGFAWLTGVAVGYLLPFIFCTSFAP